MWKVLCCVVFVIGLSHGAQGANREPKSHGVGAYAYQDSAGNRYGGTYGLKDGQVLNRNGGEDIPTFYPGNFAGNNYEAMNNFFPEYFRNFENILQDIPRARRHIILLPHLHLFEPLPPLRPLPRLFPPLPPLLPPLEPLKLNPSFWPSLPAPFNFDPPMPQPNFLSGSSARAFQNNYDGQQLALNAASKAFDITSDYAGYIPNFASRFAPPTFNPGFHGFQGYPGSPGFQGFGAPNFENYGQNGAFALGAVGPDFSHQIAALNPENPGMRNINVMNRFADTEAPTRGGFKSVSSSSMARSKNVNGVQETERSASTIINDNGKVTKYEVHS